MEDFKTDQEKLWVGDFGDEYLKRNSAHKNITASRISFWGRILNSVPEKIGSCLELGPNIGLNFKTLGILLPGLHMTGVEINEKAALECAKLDRVRVFQESILNFETTEGFDLVFTCGVLIHIDPKELPGVYQKIYGYSNRYVVIAEYYNPTPVEIEYRGNSKCLFKRDFAGDLMDQFPDLKLLDYGFVYHRDTNFPADDITWFLMEKR